MAQYTKVARVSEVDSGRAKIIEINGRTIALFNCDGTFYAIENACRHRGGPLAEGRLVKTTVTCPWHGWEFDVTSGECRLDRSIKVQSFPVRIDGEDILISV